MGVIKKNYLTIMVVGLLVGIITFLFINTILLGESYLKEEIAVKNLIIDMMCDIAESRNPRQALIDSVSEIDTLKNRGVYCAAYVQDATSANGFKIISVRSPLYDPDMDVLDNRALRRDVERLPAGKDTISIAGNAEYRGHTMDVYFRWVYWDTDSGMLIVLGMSQFAVETDHEQGLKTGGWLIAIASVVIVIVAAVPTIKRKRGGD